MPCINSQADNAMYRDLLQAFLKEYQLDRYLTIREKFEDMTYVMTNHRRASLWEIVATIRDYPGKPLALLAPLIYRKGTETIDSKPIGTLASWTPEDQARAETKLMQTMSKVKRTGDVVAVKNDNSQTIYFPYDHPDLPAFLTNRKNIHVSMRQRRFEEIEKESRALLMDEKPLPTEIQPTPPRSRR